MKHIRLFNTAQDYLAVRHSLPFPFAGAIKNGSKYPDHIGKSIDLSSIAKIEVLYDTRTNSLIGTGILYNEIMSMEVNGESFDIDDLVVTGVRGSGSGSSGSGVGEIRLPKDIQGFTTVTYHIKGIFREKAMLGDAEYFNITVSPDMLAENRTQEPFVDLGLPSGRLWATRNLGANEPGQYGGYYKWAIPKMHKPNPRDFVPSMYDYYAMKGDTIAGVTKYNDGSCSGIIDNLLSIIPQDDAATETLGKVWHIPTLNDFKELVEYTTQKSVAIDRINCVELTSKADPTKKIVIPMSGFISEKSVADVNSLAYLWTSDLLLGSCQSANGYTFSDRGAYEVSFLRHFGLNIRPVI